MPKNNTILQLNFLTNKLLLKAELEQKISLADKFFHTSISRSLENSGRNKTTLFSFHSFQLCSASKPFQSFSRVSFRTSKFTPIKLIKKDTSSSRKKTVLNAVQIL